MSEDRTTAAPGSTATSEGDPRTAIIEIERIPSWFAGWRRISIGLDGIAAGSLKSGETMTLPVEPGKRSVRAWIDWAWTPPVEVEPAPGEVVRLELTTRWEGPAGAFVWIWGFVRPSRLLVLRPASGNRGG